MLQNYIFLFDVDGTLVDITDLHVKAYQQAYKKITGKAITKQSLVSKFGMAEIETHEKIFDEYGIATGGVEREQFIADIINSYTAGVLSAIKKEGDLSKYVIRGVRGFLDYLKSQKATLGVVTGCLQPIGESILTYSQLYDYFHVYTYSDNARDRIEIVGNAISSLKKHDLLKSNSRVVVVGDSPSDIRATKTVGAEETTEMVAVGVASGPYAVEELDGADIVVKSLEEYEKIIDYLKSAKAKSKTEGGKKW